MLTFAFSCSAGTVESGAWRGVLVAAGNAAPPRTFRAYGGRKKNRGGKIFYTSLSFSASFFLALADGRKEETECGREGGREAGRQGWRVERRGRGGEGKLV